MTARAILDPESALYPTHDAADEPTYCSPERTRFGIAHVGAVGRGTRYRPSRTRKGRQGKDCSGNPKVGSHSDVPNGRTASR